MTNGPSSRYGASTTRAARFKDGYAIDYDWNQSWTRHQAIDLEALRASQAAALRAESLGVQLFAKGSYAYRDAHNDDSLSELGLSFHYQLSSTPWKNLEVAAKPYRDCVQSLDPMADDLDAQAEACWLLYTAIAPDQKAASYALDARFHATLEGNQDFSDKHSVLGAKLSVAFEPGQASALRYLNVFDYPFKLTRMLTKSRPYHASFPSLSIAFDEVDPTDDTQRLALPGGGDRYDRVAAVAAFSTQVATYKHLPITFETVFKRFDERNAPEAIKAAGLDEHLFRKTSVYFPSSMFGVEVEGGEFFVRYSSGSLPFDLASSRTVSVGWEQNLKSLGEVLGRRFLE